jgi:hypothetical protein
MKTHKLYASFTADLHGAVTNSGKPIKVMSRKGQWANVLAALDEGVVIC